MVGADLGDRVAGRLPDPAAGLLTPDPDRVLLLAQNLASDAYLRAQMDADRFVAVAVIADFKLVKAITSDPDLIVAAIRRSKLLELDAAARRVRASSKAAARTTIILRDIPADTPIDDIRAIFDAFPDADPVAVRADIADTWFVSFADERACLRTAEQLAAGRTTFLGRPVRFRVKSENQTRAFHQEKPPPLLVVPAMFALPPSWNIQQAPPVFDPRRPPPPPPLTPGEQRRRPVLRKPRDAAAAVPGLVAPAAPVRTARKPQRTAPAAVRVAPKPDDECMDGVRPQPDLSLEHFPALSRTASCPASPSKDDEAARRRRRRRRQARRRRRRRRRRRDGVVRDDREARRAVRLTTQVS